MSTAASSATEGHAPAGQCANCEAVLTGHFCANCGQEAHLHAASTREFLHEFIGHYVAVEGKLWGTMSRLLFHPGALTNEYIRGRRVRFVQPLRIYLTLSLVFFALLKFTGGFEPVIDEGARPDGAQAPASAGRHAPNGERGKAAAEAAIADLERDMKAGAPDTGERAADKRQGVKPEADKQEADKQEGGKDEGGKEDAGKEEAGNQFGPKQFDDMLSGWPRLQHQWQRFTALPQEQQKKVFVDAFYRYAPYAIFCLMPVFALFLKILYLGSGRRFGEHVLFALHTNAFAYFVFAVMLMVNVGWIDFLLWCWLLAYLPWAMRRVYHRGRFGTFWRWAVLMTSFMVCIFLASALSAASGIMTLH